MLLPWAVRHRTLGYVLLVTNHSPTSQQARVEDGTEGKEKEKKARNVLEPSYKAHTPEKLMLSDSGCYGLGLV